jgi:hypothetical protein
LLSKKKYQLWFAKTDGLTNLEGVNKMDVSRAHQKVSMKEVENDPFVGEFVSPRVKDSDKESNIIKTRYRCLGESEFVLRMTQFESL